MAQIKSYPNNVNEEIGAENVMRWHHGRTRGVYGAPGELAVAALTTPGMAVSVSDGGGWLTDAGGNGIHFWNDVFAVTAALLQLPVSTADGVLNRIDRIIVEWSTPNYTQLPEIKVLKGTNAVSAVAPALTNDASLRQISLARISIAAGTLAITAGMITDERLDPAVCGVVTENVTVDTSVAVAQLNAVIAQAQALIIALTGEAVPNHAATHAIGEDDPISPESIGAASASHAHTPASIGAAAAAIDNLTSTSTAAALSANMGRFLDNNKFSALTLLWTNASPGSSFASQTISLDLANYDAVFIECYGSNSLSGGVQPGAIFPKGRASIQYTGTYRISRRTVEVTSNGVIFGDGELFATYNSTSLTTQNSNTIPMFIYGIKHLYVD